MYAYVHVISVCTYTHIYLCAYENTFSLPLAHTASLARSQCSEIQTYIHIGEFDLEVHAIAKVLGNQRNQKQIF